MILRRYLRADLHRGFVNEFAKRGKQQYTRLWTCATLMADAYNVLHPWQMKAARCGLSCTSLILSSFISLLYMPAEEEENEVSRACKIYRSHNEESDKCNMQFTLTGCIYLYFL